MDNKKSIFIFVLERCGPPSHGEPGEPYLVIHTNETKWFELGEPSPVFTTRDLAERYRTDNKIPYYWTLKEIPLIENYETTPGTPKAN